jgi:hypothetical protein
MMQLHMLPVEIISRVCRFIDTGPSSHHFAQGTVQISTMEFDKDEEEEDEDRGDDEDIEDDSDLDLARVISQSQLPLDLDWEPEVCYNNADFQSLRFTCKVCAAVDIVLFHNVSTWIHSSHLYITHSLTNTRSCTKRRSMMPLYVTVIC